MRWSGDIRILFPSRVWSLATRGALALGTVLVVMSAAWGDPTSCPPGAPGLGAHFDATGENIRFRVASARATKVDAYLYAQPFDEDEKLVVPLAKVQGSDIWEASVPVATIRDRGITRTTYYGYRAWGPNWPFKDSWTKGSLEGFSQDVDDQGNRFNPNKLLLDPYALEMSHDPVNLKNHDDKVFATGPDHRQEDTGRVAPKGVVLAPDDTDTGDKPARPLRDEVIYEVHVRGLTKLDTSIPEKERGTYRGAARKVDYFRQLGVTAIEFLPIHEANNDGNDISPDSNGDNYWGYSTLDYFAPDRRYALDQLPGGPTREFKAMVKAFHDAGIKVYLDVVYNHTGEEGFIDGDVRSARLYSWRGLDNPTYYELNVGNKTYCNNNGVSGNFNCANKVVRDQILDSLTYWSKAMGVDGFRFDLAPILGNILDHQRPGDGMDLIFDKLPSWTVTVSTMALI